MFTTDELDKLLHYIRVLNHIASSEGASLEFVQDITELEERVKEELDIVL